MPKLYVGHHINTQWGFASSADYAHEIGANFFQIFLASPHKYAGKRNDDTQLALLKSKLEQYDQKLVIHANFMLNFCNEEKTYKHKAAVDLLIKDLKDCSKLGAIGVVIHMGKKLKMDETYAINNYVKGVQKALRDTPESSIVIFETGAGQGTEVCTKISHLGNLYRMFTPKERKRIKFCIDTCHVFAAGYDLSNERYIEIFDKMIETNLSWNNIACIHLNDSKCPLDSRKDRHADLGEGYIKKNGLKKFVQLCYKKGIPMVLETPCDSGLDRTKQIKMVKEWIS